MAIIRPEAHDDAGEKATPNQIAKGIVTEALSYFDVVLEHTMNGDGDHFDPKQITPGELKQIKRILQLQIARCEQLEMAGEPRAKKTGDRRWEILRVGVGEWQVYEKGVGWKGSRQAHALPRTLKSVLDDLEAQGDDDLL